MCRPVLPSLLTGYRISCQLLISPHKTRRLLGSCTRAPSARDAASPNINFRQETLSLLPPSNTFHLRIEMVGCKPAAARTT